MSAPTVHPLSREWSMWYDLPPTSHPQTHHQTHQSPATAPSETEQPRTTAPTSSTAPTASTSSTGASLLPLQPKDINWADLLKKVYTVKNVEEFWALYNSLREPSTVVGNYHVFREGIKPMWEDPANSRGGKWQVQIARTGSRPEKSDRDRDDERLNSMWLDTVLSCIGEQYDNNADSVCGCVVCNKRSKNGQVVRIALWTNDCANTEANLAIGHRFKEILKIGDGMKISYIAHSDALQKGGNYGTTPRLEI
eukprot:TRINITY_DN16268_c0_g1_i1.p1 TRINITY_DN16268_c0_g1~~TRINITY_DN16268_c0_g1_i1.p1  ORF type:complete len:252 (-),score=39.39 TRINITY_DN16268_c0_g1_i1:39-794(-)